MTRSGANGNLLSVTDPLSHTVASYAYNSMDRPTSRTDAVSQQDTFTYDANGHLHTATNRNGKVTTYTYDHLDRLTQVTFDDASTISYTYDAGNRVTQIVDSVYGTIARTYTGRDQLASETTPQGVVSYTYDAAGRRSAMTVTGQPEIDYAYDSASRLTSITRQTTPTATVVSFTYDSANRRSTITFPNGVVGTYTYDTGSRVTAFTFTKSSTTVGTLTYTYDAAGHRTAIGGSLAGAVLPSAVSSATYNNANRLTNWNGTTLTYDTAGNLTADGTNTYTWNARNTLSAISGGVSASFAYDPVGRRSSKTVGSTTTGFLYDGANVVQTADGTTTTNLVNGAGIDETLVQDDGTTTQSLLADALGSIVALTNGSGSIATQYTYGPFGDVQVTGSSSANASQFAGRENDGTGLTFMRARYYSPALQRFISDDPMGVGGGINQTVYAGNNPLSLTDPLGLYESNPNNNSSGDSSAGSGGGGFGGGVDGGGNGGDGSGNGGGGNGGSGVGGYVGAGGGGRNDGKSWYQNSCITGAIGDGLLHVAIDSIGLIPEAGGLARALGNQGGYRGVIADQLGAKAIHGFGLAATYTSGAFGANDTSSEGMASTGLAFAGVGSTLAGATPVLGQFIAGAAIVVDIYTAGKAIAKCD